MNNGVEGQEGQPIPDIEYLNEFAERLNEAKARELCTDAINLVHEACTVFLQADKEMIRNKSDDTVIPRFLQLDFLASPGYQLSELRTALSYQMIRTKERAPGDTFGADRIKVYMPVEEDFVLGPQVSYLPPTEEIDEIYVLFEKDYDDETHTRRFAITREGVYEYVAPSDPDHESEAGDIFDRDLHDQLTDTQRLNVLMVSQLIEDHRNFNVVYQT